MILVSERESVEFMVEGLKRASSAAKQLSSTTGNLIWRDIAEMLVEMSEQGQFLATSKALSHTETLRVIDNYNKRKEA